jgi:hypothetical protein
MITVKDFRCNGCGAPLPIPKNSKGHVKCPSCKTECVIEGLVKNAEIAAKEDINSGYPLFTPPAVLHKRLVSLLSESPNMPWDVFEKGEVVREEHYCVPAYCFYCNGTASFTYEVGNKRAQTYTVDRGDRVEIIEKTRIEWSPGSSSAAVSQTVFVPGNKKLATEIEKLYKHLDPNKLVDIEELDFPLDVETYTYNLPQPAAFAEYVVPGIEQLLKEKAKESIANLNARGFSMSGTNIQKETVRVFLGLYRVVFKYGDKEYSFWATGDGGKVINGGMPSDSSECQKALAVADQSLDGENKLLAEAQQVMKGEIAALPNPKTGLLSLAIFACIVAAVALFFFHPSFVSRLFWAIAGHQFVLGTWIWALLAAPFVAGMIVLGVKRSKKRKPYNTERAKIEAKHKEVAAEIEARKAKIEAQKTEIRGRAAAIARQFKEQKKALRGIYEELSGDASAFPA